MSEIDDLEAYADEPPSIATKAQAARRKNGKAAMKTMAQLSAGAAARKRFYNEGTRKPSLPRLKCLED